MTRTEVLLKAADLIEERGWFQGEVPYALIPPLCANLALDEAAGAPRLNDYPSSGQAAFLAFGAAQFTLITHLRLPARDVGFGQAILDWNDEPGRTQEEVIAALRRAAQEAT